MNFSDQKMKDLISKIRMEAYEFKDPWRATNKSLTIVVPIVAKQKGVRDYVVLEEVKDKVSIVDTGGIDKVQIEGDADKPTFIRGGTMLKGATQERATQFGIVLIPKKSEQIPVHCIHASRGIRAGASLQLGGYAPRRVYSTILSDRSQNSTWSAVHDYSSQFMDAARRQGEIGLFRSHLQSDDLVSIVEIFDTFRKDLREILKQIPDYTDQVGVIIVDPDGVVGLEMYDHPDSWKAFSEPIMRSYAEALIREDKSGIFKPDMTATVSVIKDFLKAIENVKEEQVFSKNHAKTAILRTQDYVGEYTSLNEKTIHLLMTRARSPRTQSRTIEPFLSSRAPQESTFERILEWGRRFKSKAKKGMHVLTALQDKPKTWTSLRSTARMSKATLASRLKELQELGAVEKSKDENGITRYSLTGMGHEYLSCERISENVQQALKARTLKTTLIEVCPKCESPQISVWGFDAEKTSYECNKCHHKWTEPRNL